MKKLLSAMLVLAMMASVLCISTSAAGIKLNMNFESMESFTESFHAGNFFVSPEGGALYGYNEARALQTKYEDKEFGYFVPAPYCWLTYDTSVDIIIADDDMDESDRSVAVVYANDNPYYFGTAEERIFMAFTYDIKDNCFRLCNYMENREPDGQFVDPVPVDFDIDIEGNETHKMGMSVERGRIRCFFDDVLVIDYVDTEDEYKIAQELVSPFLFWQRGNFVQISNISVSDAGYLYPHPAEEPTTSETTTKIVDDPVDGTTTKAPEETSETTTAIVTSVVTDEKGETSIVTSIVTEATTTPKAETNVHNNNGGSSTSTGDATFMVIAAMVATLGCAVIVKKVNVK